MKNVRTKLVGFFMGLALVLTARADSIINNFNNSFNYLASGILGDTNWDGVYLNGGDILGGTSAGGTTLQADSSSFPGFLTVQETRGAWVGNQDDSFFLYKVVQGDFDASVQISFPFASLNYHLPGLLARAFNPNGTGTPYSATDTNAVENWMYIARFQEFGINEHGRYATNGADVNGFFDTAGDDADTNSTRYLRITRVGNTFSFYDKTNQSDAWNLCSTLDRPDLDGIAMQVGIKDESGTANAPVTYFTDFELSGTNVTFPAMPTPPSNLVTTATNINGTLTFSWSKGSPSDGSLVVISRKPLQHYPVQGITYAADATFGSSNILGGANEYVAYNSTGNSVTVSNLGPYTIKYNVAVFEYSGSGASTVYNTAAPATNTVAGPGIVNAVSLTINSTNLPVAGATKAHLLASFSTGQSNLDVSLDPNTVWTSSDPSIATVSSDGTISGIGVGTATITADYGSGAFVLSTTVTVHGPVVYTDNFTATNDYLNDGLIGSTWDGLFLNFGDVPGGAAGNDGAGLTTALNSQITSTNGLEIDSTASTWQGSADDGPFLFKLVPGANNVVSGDFQVSAHINNMNTLNGVVAGLMARLYNPTSGGPGPGGRENHVNYWKVQNGTTSVRQVANNATTTLVANGPSGTDGWLLIQRVDSTNFYFFEKANVTDPWIYLTNSILTQAAGDAPMQVGLAEQTTLGASANAVFDSFWLDASGISGGATPPPAATSFEMVLNPSDLSLTLNWVAEDGSGNPVPSIVVMRANGPVTAQPIQGGTYTASSTFGQGTDLGGHNYVVFVSADPPATTNNTVTVTGLSPGVTYYAAVYTFGGTGTNTAYNVSSAPSATLVDGLPLTLVTPPPPDIPMGGIGAIQALVGYGSTTPVVYVDRSGAVAIASNDTNVIKALSGVLTGITNGSSSVTVTYTEGAASFTNDVNVTVRPPTFTDNFSASHDYLAAGVTGTPYDGLYNPNASSNPVPASVYVPLALSGTTVADANVSSNNALTITSAGDGWEGGAAGGFFLYKYVPGDFEMAAHINSFDVAGYNQPGLMARAYSVTNGMAGAPFGYIYPDAGGTNDAGEYWVSLTRFDEFGIGTYARLTIDGGISTVGAGGTLQNTQPDQGDGSFWLMIVRSRGSEFDFYKRVNATDPWRKVPNKTHYSIGEFVGQPMQVGLMGGPWTGTSGNQRTVRFDSFMLDTTTGLQLTAINDGSGNVILSWPAFPNAQLQSTDSLNPTNWQPVGGTPVLGPAGYSQSVPIGSGAKFFRLQD